MIRSGNIIRICWKAAISSLLATGLALAVLAAASPAYAEDAEQVARCRDFQRRLSSAELSAANAVARVRGMNQFQDRYSYGELRTAENDARRELQNLDSLISQTKEAGCFTAPKIAVSAQDEAITAQNSAIQAEHDRYAANVQTGTKASEDAYRLYEQGNRGQACESSKAATIAWRNAQTLGRAFHAQHPEQSINIDQVNQNAAASAADEVEFYCK
jgi:hypothetical protein